VEVEEIRASRGVGGAASESLVLRQLSRPYPDCRLGFITTPLTFRRDAAPPPPTRSATRTAWSAPRSC